MEAIHTEEYKNMTLNIYQDDDPESPREWDNLGTMVCFHREYDLGDKDHGIDKDSYFSDKIGDTVYCNSWNDIQDQIVEKYGDLAVILPLSLYDHSGISISVGAPQDVWDSGYIGFIFVTKEKVKKEYNIKRITKKILNRVKNCLVSEVKTYDQYLTGDVYGYVTDDDSCWGFYGMEEAIKEGKNAIDCTVKYNLEKHEKQLNSYIKNNVPLQYRVSVNA